MEREDWKNSSPAPSSHPPRKKIRMLKVAFPKTLGVCMPPSPCSSPAHPGRREPAGSFLEYYGRAPPPVTTFSPTCHKGHRGKGRGRGKGEPRGPVPALVPVT